MGGLTNYRQRFALCGAAFVALCIVDACVADPLHRARAAVAYAALFIPTVALVALAWRRDDRFTVVAVVVLAVVARISFAAAQPLWSNDAYRYVWDGRLAERGIDPRSIAPSDPRLRSDRTSPLWPDIDLREIPTVYPPLAISLFRIAARLDPEGVAGAKAVSLGGDLATLAILIAALRRAGLPRGRVAIYALHPLVLVSFSQDAHIESIAVAGTCGALGFGGVWRLAGLAAAIITKLYPVIFAPLVLVRDPGGTLVTAAIVGLSFLPAIRSGHPFGSIGAYVGEQRFNEALFAAVGPVGAGAVLLASIVAGAIAVRRGRSRAAATYAVAIVYLCATPNALPWYLTILPALVVLIPDPFARRGRAIVNAGLLWTATVALAYGAPWYFGGGSRVDWSVRLLEYGPTLAMTCCGSARISQMLLSVHATDSRLTIASGGRHSRGA